MKEFKDLPEPMRVAWVAGVFEHSVTINTRDYNIKIESANKEFLERIQETLGIGKVYPKRPGPHKPKETYMFKCENLYEIVILLKKMIPFLTTIKKQQATERVRQIQSTAPYKKIEESLRKE